MSTYDTPTKEGFFWWRRKENEPWEVVRVWRDYDGSLTLFRATDACSNFDIIFGQWGPEVPAFHPITKVETDADGGDHIADAGKMVKEG